MSGAQGATRNVSVLISTMTPPGKEKNRESGEKSTEEGGKVKRLEEVHHADPTVHHQKGQQGPRAGGSLPREGGLRERGHQSKLNSPSPNGQDNQSM